MPDPIFSDNAFSSAKFALDGLAKRTEILGNNLANVDTPGYQAQTLNFEQALARASQDSGKLRLSVTNEVHLKPRGEALDLMTTAPRQSGTWRTDGNNVNVDTELNEMAETGIRYQAISQLVTKKLMLLKTVASGR
jgi:flagellar basal-body rod protein FlgB